MKNTLRVAACIALCIVHGCRIWGSGMASHEARSVVATGHKGAVLALELDEKRGLLFSAGDDGTLRVWESKTGSLVHRLHVTGLSAGMIAVNPAAPQIAVLATDGIRSFAISVWNWETEKLVFRTVLSEAPLFLSYSGMGKYLAWGVSAWSSLQIVDSTNGTPVVFHPEGFGIVGFAEMSRSEKTILTYQVSGRLAYWDIASGSLVKELPCVSYLSGIRISSDRRYIAGIAGDEIVVVDTLSGSVRSRVSRPGAVSVAYSPSGEELLSLSTNGGRAMLSRWAFSGDSLVPLAWQQPSLSPSVMCYGNGELFIADAQGTIVSLSDAGAERTIGRDELAAVSGFDVMEGAIAVGSAEWIRVFRTDILSSSAGKAVGSAAIADATYVRSTLAPNPFGAPVGLAFLGDGRLLAWPKGGAEAALAVLDVGARDFHAIPTGFRAPIVDLEVNGSRLVALEKGGTIRVVDMQTGASRFEAWRPGVAAITEISATDLVGGRNAASASEGSLLRINTKTGETVAISGRSVFIYELLYDPARDALYSIGVDAEGSTDLLMHDGKGLERETLIDSVEGENLFASISRDPATGLLYSSLGRDSVGAWDGARLERLPLGSAVPRRLLARDGLLFSLNKDSTLSVVDAASGVEVAELSLFGDGEWCLVAERGGYAASPGGDIHVGVFVGNTMTDTREDFRLRVKVEN